MSNRLQDIYRAYDKRQLIIENNKKISDECYKSLMAIKKSISEETLAVINSYSPGILDTLELKEQPTMEDIIKLKNSLNSVLDILYTSVESELS